MNHRHAQYVSALGAVLVLSVVVSACGGAGSTPSAAPTPTAALASVCYGSVSDEAFFAEAASSLSIDVYCAGALPAGWTVTGHVIRGTDYLGIAYTGPGTSGLKLDEGRFCTTSTAACSPHDEDLGTAMFGDLKGGVFLTNVRAAYSVYVLPGTDHAYALTGQGMDLAEFKEMAAAFVRVPRP